MTLDASINYRERSFEEILTDILVNLQRDGLLSNSLNVADIVSDPKQYADYIIVMDAANYANGLANSYKELTKINNSSNVDTAPANNPLQPSDALAVLGTPFIGPPQSAGYATTEVIFHSDEPATMDRLVPRGFNIACELNSAIIVQTMENVVLAEGETDIRCPVVCTIPGPGGNQPENTFTIMQSYIEGIDSVTNPDASSGGTMGETPESYIIRFKNWTYSNIRGTYAALVTAITKVTGVKGYYIEPRPLDDDGEPQDGLVNITIDPPIESLLTQVANSLESWKAVKENVNIVGVVEKPINLDVHANFSLDNPMPYSESELDQYNSQVKTYVRTYINGGLNRDGSVRENPGIGQDFTKSRANAYVMTQIPQLKSLILTLDPDVEIVSIAANEKAVAGEITVSSI